MPQCKHHVPHPMNNIFVHIHLAISLFFLRERKSQQYAPSVLIKTIKLYKINIASTKLLNTSEQYINVMKIK